MATDTIDIKVCLGTSGNAAGGEEVLRLFKHHVSEQGIEAQVGKRCEYTKVGCRGFCSKDVLVDVIANGSRTTYQSVRPIMVERIVREHLLGGTPIAEWTTKEDYAAFNAKQYKIVLGPCGDIDPESIDDYLKMNGYRAARKAMTKMTPDAVVDGVAKSGLRGRGGSGFLTGEKWRTCRSQPERTKYIICNVGEVNRSLAEGNPHSIIEGLLIGGYAIGAVKGYIYIRERYHLSVERLRSAITQARERQFLGKNLFGSGFDFDIEFSFGTEAFICGEETALMESIEGKRAMPRVRPPFPAFEGLYGKPTVINNAETFSNIPLIIGMGADWYASIGTEESKGTKVFTLSGKVRNNGLVEIPMGMSARSSTASGAASKETGRSRRCRWAGPPAASSPCPSSTWASITRACARSGASWARAAWWCSTRTTASSRSPGSTWSSCSASPAASARPAAWAPSGCWSF